MQQGATAILATLFLCPVARAQGPAVDLRGIYVGGNNITNENAKSLTAALNVPGVDGLLLNIGWDEIEPAIGQYQWTTLDQWITEAILDGKKITVSVGAGMHTPSWLFQPTPGGAGAKPLSFSIARKDGQTGVCDSEIIAAPWDTAFLKQWDSMLAALSAHLKSAGTYDAVVLLRLTGINRDTDELHLPTETAQSTHLSCVSDAIATWVQAGYRPSLLLQGWDGITSSFRKSFPDKSFTVAIIARTNTPFPPIAEDGSVIANVVSAENQPPLALASQKFPGPLVIQNNTLHSDAPAQPTTIQFAQSLGTMIAFQTNEDLASNTGKRASCPSAPPPALCTDATYIDLLDTGIYPLGQSNSLRAQYIELFASDAIAFPDDIQQAHLSLVPGAHKPLINSGGVVIHAGAATAVSPGSLVDIYGLNLAASAALASAGPALPVTLGAVQVRVNGAAAPLIYVGPLQIVFQMPYETALGTAAVVVVSNNTASASAPVTVQQAAPFILTYGSNRAVVINPDTSLNASGNGAKPASVLVAYLVGSGPLDNPISTGAPAPLLPLSQEKQKTGVLVGGSPAVVQFAGMAPGSVGLVQINFVTPNISPGDYPMQVTIGSAASNQPLLTVSR